MLYSNPATEMVMPATVIEQMGPGQWQIMPYLGTQMLTVPSNTLTHNRTIMDWHCSNKPNTHT